MPTVNNVTSASSVAGTASGSTFNAPPPPPNAPVGAQSPSPAQQQHLHQVAAKSAAPEKSAPFEAAATTHAQHLSFSYEQAMKNLNEENVRLLQDMGSLTTAFNEAQTAGRSDDVTSFKDAVVAFATARGNLNNAIDSLKGEQARAEETLKYLKDSASASGVPADPRQTAMLEQKIQETKSRIAGAQEKLAQMERQVARLVSEKGMGDFFPASDPRFAFLHAGRSQ